MFEMGWISEERRASASIEFVGYIPPQFQKRLFQSTYSQEWYPFPLVGCTHPLSAGTGADIPRISYPKEVLYASVSFQKHPY